MPLAPRLLPDAGALLPRLRARSLSISRLQIVLALAMLAAIALGQVHLRLQVIAMGYAISRESRVKHDLEDQNQKLRLELATRRDPALIERRAREELFMVPPDTAAIRTLRLPRAGRQPAGAP